MTYDELLDEIVDNFNVCGDDCVSCKRDNAPWSALYATVKLHKPKDGKKFCKMCGKFFPCLTIQIIEKELG